MSDELGAWHLSVLGGDLLHAEGQRGLGARVALLDTGVEVEHPRFADANLRAFDARELGVAGDDFGHGTEMAGLIVDPELKK